MRLTDWQIDELTDFSNLSSIRPFVNSSIRQFVNSSIRQFVNSSIRQFVHLTDD